MFSNKVLVTGATGFIGANLVRRLHQEGCEVHITTRKNSNKWRLKGILPKLTDHLVDLREEEKLKRVVRRIKPNIIYHLANAGLYGGVSLSEKELIETNILGTVNLIKACANIDYTCFVNTGSSSEYGTKNDPMKETDICQPVNMYGIVKLASTLYGNFAAKTCDEPIVCLRLFSPFGSYNDQSRLITYAIVNTLLNRPLELANPQAVRDFIFIEDVIDAYLKLIDLAPKFKGGIFNIGSGSQTSVATVVEKIIQFTNSNSSIRWHTIDSQAQDSPMWEADITKAVSCLDWRPSHSFDQGLKKTILWFKENLSFYSRI